MKPPKRPAMDESHMTLLDICLALHMESTGASDAMTKEERHELRSYLQYRLDNWKEFHGPGRRHFDNAVKALCVIALEEPHWLTQR